MTTQSDHLADLRTAGLSYSLLTPNVVTTPKVARDQIRSILRSLDLDHVADTAALLTSELATNAYFYAQGEGDSVLRIALKGPTLRVTVYDGSPELPRRRRPDDQDPSGRGLQLVELCADKWGVITPRDAEPMTKGVWFELGL